MGRKEKFPLEKKNEGWLKKKYDANGPLGGKGKGLPGRGTRVERKKRQVARDQGEKTKMNTGRPREKGVS